MTQPQHAQQHPGFAPPAQQFAPQQTQFAQPAPAPAQEQQGFFGNQAQPEQQNPDTGGFFGGAPSISFNAATGYQKGTPRGGRVTGKKISNQTNMKTGAVLVWNDGSPRKQMEITLATNERSDPNDSGERRLFVKGDMTRAVREAFAAVGAKDVELGGWVYVAWIDEKPPIGGNSPQKIYKAVYALPGAPDPMAGQPAYAAPAPPPAAAPPQQFAQPAPAWSGQAGQQAVAATGMDPAYATQAQQQAAWQAQQAPAAQPQQFAPQGGAQAQLGAPQQAAAPGGYNPFG